MHPASLAKVPAGIVVGATSAVMCAVAVVESSQARTAVALAVKLVWLYFVTGSRG
jgi:hypothetical protein